MGSQAIYLDRVRLLKVMLVLLPFTWLFVVKSDC